MQKINKILIQFDLQMIKHIIVSEHWDTLSCFRQEIIQLDPSYIYKIKNWVLESQLHKNIKKI